MIAQPLTLNNFIAFGTVTSNNNTINYCDGPVGGFYASNVLLSNSIKSVSFCFSGASSTPQSGIDMYFKVFEEKEFDTGWNEDGAIFHTSVPAEQNTNCLQCSVDLTPYHGKTISLGWVFTTDAGPNIASIKDIIFDQTPHPPINLHIQ